MSAGNSLTDYPALVEPLSPSAPLWAWAYQGITERAETMLEHLEGVRLGEDIEAVHDMRVWSRRLVAAMRVFGGCFPDRGYRRLVREARDVTGALGGVRDLDVLIDHFQRSRTAEETGANLGIDYFIAVQQRLRRRARVPMLNSLGALVKSRYAERVRRYLRSEAEMYAAGLHPALTHDSEGTCRVSFASAAPAIIEQRYHAFYAFEPYVANPEAVTELHDMRIAAKWLRYTMELFAPAYAEELKRPLTVVKRFQELLGDLHDCDIRIEILQQMLANPLDADGLMAVNRMLPEPVEAGLALLLERERRERAGFYAGFCREWRKMERKGFRQACLEQIHSTVGGDQE